MQAGRAHDAGGPSNSMRLIALIFLLLTVAAPARAQVGFDRPGGDYANFPIRGGDPAACALRCEHEARCLAWAFS